MVNFEILVYTLASVILVSLISLLGVITLSLNVKRLSKILLFLVSLSAGTLLGDAFIHLLPEVVEEFEFGIEVSLYVILGMLIFFIIEKFIHWTHCHEPVSKKHVHSFGVMNLIGDGLHNFGDGVLIAGSYLVNFQLGMATTIAVVLHEIPQEISDFGVLIHSGFTTKKAVLYNVLSAVAAIIGALISLYLGGLFENYNLLLLPLTAGGFIYIAAADLIPELHKERDGARSIMQLIGIIIGVGIMVALIALE
ncbi:MAG: ZIP family metal transporter [Nanoarchaeota archaeon]